MSSFYASSSSSYTSTSSLQSCYSFYQILDDNDAGLSTSPNTSATDSPSSPVKSKYPPGVERILESNYTSSPFSELDSEEGCLSKTEWPKDSPFSHSRKRPLPTPPSSPRSLPAFANEKLDLVSIKQQLQEMYDFLTSFRDQVSTCLRDFKFSRWYQESIRGAKTLRKALKYLTQALRLAQTKLTYRAQGSLEEYRVSVARLRAIQANAQSIIDRAYHTDDGQEMDKDYWKCRQKKSFTLRRNCIRDELGPRMKQLSEACNKVYEDLTGLDGIQRVNKWDMWDITRRFC